MRYAAFLRGINISGKNKIPMVELKKYFEKAGFEDVITLLNSGNILFTSNKSADELYQFIPQLIKDKFSLDIPVFIRTKEDLTDCLRHAPDWWGTENKEIYDNIIFLSKDLNYEEFLSEIGPLKDDLEQAESYKDVIFWSYNLQNYQKTAWWSRTATVETIRDRITIRTANTVRKLMDK